MKKLISVLLIIISASSMAYAQQSTQTLTPISDPSSGILPMVAANESGFENYNKALLYKYDQNGNPIKMFTIHTVTLVDKKMQGVEVILILKKFNQNWTEVEDIKLYSLKNQDCPINQVRSFTELSNQLPDGTYRTVPNTAELDYTCKRNIELLN